MVDPPRLTLKLVPLGSPEAGDPRMGGTVSELVAAVAVLSAEGWRLAGRTLPTYTRATMPIVVTTRADHRGSV